MVIVIGYSTFALILIRASADTPMNQNTPRDVFSLRGYLAREQYGETPLLYGKTFSSEQKLKQEGRYCVGVYKKGTKVWSRVIKNSPDDKDRYEVTGENERPEYVEETCMLFPRMYSSEGRHVEEYKSWGHVQGTPVKVNQCGETKTVIKPTFAENLRFFFDYQLNFMYWRYFMWNFSGRQNDLQGYGEIQHGNWITGIGFLDEPRVGPIDDMPNDIAKNKGHNVFYMLPLILGIIGIVFQAFKSGSTGVQSFWITFFLFFMTGIAIVLYLNQTPWQPRERDYAYAGSFYAFCIWIGIGVAGVTKMLERAKLSPVTAGALATLVCVLVPIQMASQTWDDHDRSGRYIARDFGRNYLESCEPNAIIFTHGDNDTFPLWYVQEVEGVRTDVRVCNTSYLQTDWYINQMKRQAYNSEPLPISWTYKDYIQGKRDFIRVYPNTDPVDLGMALNYAISEDDRRKLIIGERKENIIPSSNLVLKIDSADVVSKHVVNPEFNPAILKQLDINLSGKTAITKVDAITLDMLNTNKWERPIYYAATVPSDIYGFLENNIQKTGIAYQVVPLYTKDTPMMLNTKKMYDNVMNKFRWGGLDKPGLYLDETVMRMCKTYRSVVFADLANALLYEGKVDSAVQVLDKCIEVINEANAPHDYTSYHLARLYYQANQNEKGNKVAASILDYGYSNIDWMLRLKPAHRALVDSDLDYNMNMTRSILSLVYQYDRDFAQTYMDRFNMYYDQYNQSKSATNR